VFHIKNNSTLSKKADNLGKKEKSAYAGMICGGIFIFWYVLLFILPFLNGQPLTGSFVSWPSFAVFIAGLLFLVFAGAEVVYCRYHLKKLDRD
jgi:uncharacterized membrane protein YbhN (UPF0104 family)